MRTLLALFALFLATSAQAQQRQPANVSTLPQSSPQEFDLLDNTGKWVPFGTASGGAFTPSGGIGTDVRQFGCVADGVTDQAACINNAIAQAPGCVIIPPSTNGFYVAPGSTINATKCLKGSFYNPDYSTPYPAAFAGQSWIKCGTSATSICVKTTYDGAYFENLTIATSFPPAVGSIGLQVAGGYNSQLRNVNISGFDQCAYWGPIGTGFPGISSHGVGLNLSWCQTHYVVDDGWPELYITDGRWGANAQGATPTPTSDVVYITKSINGGAGAGPGSLLIANVQANPGGGYVQCMVRWGGWAGTGGAMRQYKFIGDHFEFVGGTSGKHGIFCSDATVPLIAQLYVTDSELAFDGAGGGGVFALDPATSVENLSITNAFLGGDDTTLVFTPGGTAATASQWTNSYFGGPLHLTGNSTRRLASANNIFGAAVIDGTWGRSSFTNDNFASWNDSAARGPISVTNSQMNSWTPVVKFGGAASTLTWTTSGLMQRTSGGGFWATFTIVGPGSGTEGSTGVTTITGLPYKCGSGFTGNAPWNQLTVTAAVGTFVLRTDSTDPANINVLKQVSGGLTNTTQADFTNATNLSGTITCGSAS